VLPSAVFFDEQSIPFVSTVHQSFVCLPGVIAQIENILAERGIEFSPEERMDGGRCTH
jgi:hypothetical protein